MTAASTFAALALVGLGVAAGAQAYQPTAAGRQAVAQPMDRGPMMQPMARGQQSMMSNPDMQRQMSAMADGCRRMMERMPQTGPTRR